MKQAFTRKEFLKAGGKASCGLVLAGAFSMLSSCASVKVFQASSENGRIRVPLSAFAESNVRLVRVPDAQYDIALVKKDDQYTALLMRCTHQDWNLTASSSTLNCSLHGSSFDLGGNVINGPAAEPLKKFNTTIEDQYIIIS